jgi:hypothetical protein
MQYHRCRDPNCENCKKIVSDMVPYPLDYGSEYTSKGGKSDGQKPYRIFASAGNRISHAIRKKHDLNRQNLTGSMMALIQDGEKI